MGAPRPLLLFLVIVKASHGFLCPPLPLRTLVPGLETSVCCAKANEFGWGRVNGPRQCSRLRMTAEDEAVDDGLSESEKKKGGLIEGEAVGPREQETGEASETLNFPSIPNPFSSAFDAGRNLRETLANALDQLTRTSNSLDGVKIRSLEEYEKRQYSAFDSEEEVPEVLVVGATGETGRVVVRKLLLRGFRVRVLVRDLFSSTLDLLGTGVKYAKGDLTNQKSIVDSVSGCDKVVFCAQARDPSEAEMVEFEGLKNMVEAFQDQRVALYGHVYSTKKTLFRLNRQIDRDLWRLAEPYAGVSWSKNKYGHGTLGSVKLITSGYITVESTPINLNLSGFSGLALRCLGDGKTYRLILRDQLYGKTGIQFEATIQTKPNKWMTHRVPFSIFQPFLNGEAVGAKAGIELDRSTMQQIGVAYKRTPTDSPVFILSLHYIKVYRTQLEPEFIYMSSAGIPPLTDSNYETELEALRTTSPKDYHCARAEEVLRKSGLSYTIVRVGGFNNAPGGVQAIQIKQDAENIGRIARADAAEIIVQCLLDPRACNVAFYTSTSPYAPSATDPTQKMTNLFGRMQPNT
ncbi:unnamed protein product [Discosporangium mesarthrocarpum]